MKNRKMILQILVPLLIIVVIGGMWRLKNQPNDSEGSASVDVPNVVSNEATTEEQPDHLQDADFSLEVTEAVDFEALASFGLPIIVDYGADTCIPCKKMAPVLEKFNAETYGKAFIKFANVWKYADIAKNVPIQLIPTQIFVNADGTPFIPSEELASQIQFLTYSGQETDERGFTVHQGGLTEEEMRLILAEMGVDLHD
ncbi:MAG: thioredoxin domain-containing protein [Thermoguttaceae bacterium]